MNRILSSFVAATIGTLAIGAQAQSVGVGDAPAYPQGVTQYAATASAAPQAVAASYESEYVLKGDVFVRNDAYHADSAKTRAEVRRDAAAAPRARLDDASTRG